MMVSAAKREIFENAEIISIMREHHGRKVMSEMKHQAASPQPKITSGNLIDSTNLGCHLEHHETAHAVSVSSLRSRALMRGLAKES